MGPYSNLTSTTSSARLPRERSEAINSLAAFFRVRVYTPPNQPSRSSPPVPETSCATCNRVDVEEIPPAPILKRQVANNLEDDFHTAFESMVLSLPPSERVKVIAKFEKSGIDQTVDSPAAQELVGKAYALYQKRLERSRAGSARRRLAKKTAARAAEPAVAEPAAELWIVSPGSLPAPLKLRIPNLCLKFCLMCL